MQTNKIDLLSDKEFTDLVNSCGSISDVLATLGYSTNGNSWGNNLVKERMIKLNLSFKKKSVQLSKVLHKDSSYNRTKLKERLFKEGIKEYKCECCGISEWNGKPISLQLHHINGINNDNRLENLQILCPNCHSQTDNFTNKGRGMQIVKKAEELPKEDVDIILNTVKEFGIVEARKKLSYRNSLINAVVKYYKEKIIMEDLDGNSKEFTTVLDAAKYLHYELGIGAAIESVRPAISKCCSGKQKLVAGKYKFYKRSVEV